MTASAAEFAFQADILRELLEDGWVQGAPAGYDRARALYPQDCLAFVKKTQPKVWEKYTGLYPNDPEGAFLDRLTAQLDKADPNASDKHLRRFGTLGVLRHGLQDRSCTFKLCQFKPDHALNPDMLGDFVTALDDAVMESAEAHQAQMNQVLTNKEVAAGFGRIVFDLLVAQMKGRLAGDGGPSSGRG